jgi:CMP-N,N'-diacetyllegionaminic acid synthase
MRALGKIVAHIPARAGSKRVKAKNLRLLNGKPLLSYSIECAIKAKVFDEVYVNSDSDEMLKLAESLGAKGYKRNVELASDTATGDEFTIDFILQEKPDTLVMINPVCPLVTADDIKDAIEKFQNSTCDTLITCESTQMQTFSQGEAININSNEQLVPTQLNPSVETLNWAVTIWDAKQFIKNFELTGSAYIGKIRELFPIHPLHAVKISKEEDFAFAEALLKSQNEKINNSEVQYWSSVSD